MSKGQLFQFKSPEVAKARSGASRPPWKVLSVEDDPGYQASLKHACAALQVDERHIELMTARSALEAARIIPEHPDISVILLDVVMEEDDAGLKLVSTIRELIGNQLVRIVLLTGQPGMAPRTDIMRHYDIDDYWCKSDLTHEHLLSVMNGNIRTWDRTRQLERARQGLQIIVDASQSLSQQRDLQQYTQSVLSHLGSLLDVEAGGIVCALQPVNADLDESDVMAASGNFVGLQNHSLQHIADREMLDTIEQAIDNRRHVFMPGYTVLNFVDTEQDNSRYLVVVRTKQGLEQAEINLLEVFCENISTGFRNIALYNRLNRLAYQDTLLEVPNRNYLKRALRQMTTPESEQHLFITVRLHELNDAALIFGEDFCDDVLSALIERLKSLCEGPALVARLDRYDFALLAPAAEIHPDFQQALQSTFCIDGATHHIQSITSVVQLKDCIGSPAEQILRLGELAVEGAMRDGKRFVTYDPSHEQQMRERQLLLDKLRQALDQKSFTLAFQPKVCLQSGTLKGFEALARWTDHDGTPISPGVFIPLAETAGLINELDFQVFEMTQVFVQALLDQNTPVPVAFNTSTLDLLSPEYFEHLLARIASSGPPELLDMEITETQVMEEYEQTAQQLHKLRQIGVGISIDDFGTGYSSLSHITDLPASTLKIDRAFVSRLGESEDALHVVEMILRLSERFGFEVVAEGIETEYQQQVLTSCGCTTGQGFLFARPLPLEEALEYAREHFGSQTNRETHS